MEEMQEVTELLPKGEGAEGVEQRWDTPLSPRGGGSWNSHQAGSVWLHNNNPAHLKRTPLFKALFHPFSPLGVTLWGVTSLLELK